MRSSTRGMLVVAALVGSVALSACSSSSPTAAGGGGAGASNGGGGGGTVVKIGVDLPLSGGEAPNGQPTENGVKMAISEIQVPGFTVQINEQDDAVNGKHDPAQGARNISTLASDPTVIGVVGPFNSNVAQAEIPVASSAGLLLCSPANTNPTLTKGATAQQLRGSGKESYVRVATTDDIQGQAGADIAYTTLGKKRAYVIDDTETYGKGLADQFVQSFQQLGGTVVGHDGAGSSVTDYTSLLTKAKSLNPDVVYYGGVTTGGGGLLRKQMAAAGMADIPFIGGDGINDGSAATASSFLNLAGASGDANTYSTVAAAHDIPNQADFAKRYKAMFNTEPGSYSASAYACAQIILEALKNVGADREKVRAYVTDASHKYTTVLGTLGFDQNGDTTQRIISDYKFANGDWQFMSQKDFGAAS